MGVVTYLYADIDEFISWPREMSGRSTSPTPRHSVHGARATVATPGENLET